MESSRQIEERAAAWLVARESEAWSDADQAQLTQWLDAAAVNRVAFLRLEAGWEAANRLKALGAGFARGKVPSVGELMDDAEPRPARAATWKKLAAVAATLLLLIGTGIFVYIAGPLAGDQYATPVGGVASVPLADGSSVTLNTASSIRVHMTGAERKIELTRGEVFFDVAKDPSRPFVVQAGPKRIVAVGTKFSVRRDEDDVRVAVTEGAVRVDSALLAAGAVAEVVDSHVAVQHKPVPDVEDSLSWRSGYVVFHETALADAVEEFNRYNERQIIIDDPAVGAIRLTGKFRSTNYETFVRLLEDTFPIRARHAADRIVLDDAR